MRIFEVICFDANEEEIERESDKKRGMRVKRQRDNDSEKDRDVESVSNEEKKTRRERERKRKQDWKGNQERAIRFELSKMADWRVAKQEAKHINIGSNIAHRL